MSDANTNATGPQGTSPSTNPPIVSNTQPNTPTSSIDTHVNGNDQAQSTTPTDSNSNSDHQARENALNGQSDTQPWAVMTVESTGDQAVREFHDAFHPDTPQRYGVPFPLASSIARQMTARDRRELALQPGTSQPESASNNNQSTFREPVANMNEFWICMADGFDLFDTPSIIPPVAVTDTPATLGVSREDDFSSSGSLQRGAPQADNFVSLGISQPTDSTHLGAPVSELSPRDEGRPTRLSDYLPAASTSTGDREIWTRAFIAAPVEDNTSPNSLPNSSNLSGHQDHASSADNRSVDNRNRRAPRPVGSLRRMGRDEVAVFWNDIDSSASITYNTPEDRGNPMHLTDYMAEIADTEVGTQNGTANNSLPSGAHLSELDLRDSGRNVDPSPFFEDSGKDGNANGSKD